MTTYFILPTFDSYRREIAVVGCGGTGGFVAEGLCRLLLSYPQLQLVLIDGDRVEERNLGRQNFYPEDLGRFKAQALAERLARKYRRPIAYSVSHLGKNASDLDRCALIVGCVDNAAARSAIARLMLPHLWWLDAGNGEEFGQLLMGNARVDSLRGAFAPEQSICHALPLPSLVRPELLVPAPRPRASCAQAVEAGEQGPTINQFMAALVVEMVRRLLEERLTWWQVHLDLKAGSLHTIPPTPEAVSRLTGLKVNHLLSQPDRHRR